MQMLIRELCTCIFACIWNEILAGGWRVAKNDDYLDSYTEIAIRVLLWWQS